MFPPQASDSALGGSRWRLNQFPDTIRAMTERRRVTGDARREAKIVGEEGSLVLPLAEPGPGELPSVGATSVIGDHIEDGERDPHTIAEEQ